MALFSKKQSDAPRRRQLTGKVHEQRSNENSLEDRYAFRRNRTLTGSSSSNVSGVSESNAQLKSPRVQAHELAQHRRQLGVMLFGVLIGCALVYSLIWQFTAGVAIKAPKIIATLDQGIYEKTLQSYFASRPVERLRFLTNSNALNEYVQSKNPEVAAVRIEGSAGVGTSVALLTMREPIAGWSINGRQQYVDSTGTAFARNYFTNPTVQIVDKSGIHIEAGHAVTSNRFLGFVGLTVGLAKAQGYVVQQVIIPAGKTREVELRLEGVEYPVILSIDRSAGEQIEDMTKALKWFEAKKQTPEYLDVRISGRAFYK